MRPVEPRPIAGYEPVTYAKNQPPYQVLPALRGDHPEHEVVTEWEVDEEDLDNLRRTGRLRLRIWTFGNPLQPVKLEVV